MSETPKTSADQIGGRTNGASKGFARWGVGKVGGVNFEGVRVGPFDSCTKGTKQGENQLGTILRGSE